MRRSSFIDAFAVGVAVAGGASDEKPPVGVVLLARASTAASSRPSSTAASAAAATVRPRTGKVDFTVSGTSGFAFQSASEVS